MKRDIQRIMLAAVVPLFLIFILFLLKFMEVGMDWDFSHMGVYPMEKRGIAGRIFMIIWIGAGLLTFMIGKPGWHIGASGLIYGLAFFLFFSGILRKYVPLIAISLLVTFLYGGIIWHMFPYFSPANMSWEGHLSGGIMGTLCAFGFLNHGPQRPEPFADETDDDEEEESPEEDINDHNTTDSTDITSQIPVTAYAMPQSAR